ncbi:hypothetical protein U1Q18_031620, partial [Sarracenia purpurea var. burkii]
MLGCDVLWGLGVEVGAGWLGVFPWEVAVGWCAGLLLHAWLCSTVGMEYACGWQAV